MGKKIVLLIALISWMAMAWAQLTIRVTDLPANTPLSDNIHIAGNFNNWNPGDANFILERQSDGRLQIVLRPPVGTVEFKFTRGAWTSVEGDARGGERPNRTLQYNGQPVTVEFAILSWKDLTNNPLQGSTAAPNVQVLSQNFFMPQLNRSRRIWIYLPPDYARSNKRYPVLYMHDGQNLFDARTSFSGEWQVDETLNRVFDEKKEGLIVVGIENGGPLRLNEYSPWVNTRYGGGEGDEYAEFIVKTLKPYVDANYRTRPQREHTGICGSSMGGLISLYAGIEYQQTFSKVGVFSPALWFAPQSYTHVSATGKVANMKFYLLAGQREDNGSVVRDVQSLYYTLRSAGFDQRAINIVTPADGQHSEWFWAREFPAAYRWLYTRSDNETAKTLETTRLQFTQSGNRLQFRHRLPLEQARYRIFTANGTEVITPTPLPSDAVIDVGRLTPGDYVVLLYDGDRLVESQKFTVR